MITNFEELEQIINEDIKQVYTVKPRVIFKLIEDTFGKPISMNLNIPYSGLGSVTMLEASILISILKLVDPENCFEFGTFLGYTTAIITENTSPDCKVYSIDLDENKEISDSVLKFSEFELHNNDIKNDDYLKKVQSVKGAYYLNNIEKNILSKVKLIKGDSMDFNPENYNLKNKVDFVFIDGGHQFENILKDTQSAMDMTGGKGVIIWHDYNSSIHKDVTQFLDEFSKNHIIFHIQHTLIAILINKKFLIK